MFQFMFSIYFWCAWGGGLNQQIFSSVVWHTFKNNWVKTDEKKKSRTETQLIEFQKVGITLKNVLNITVFKKTKKQ